MKKIKLTMSSHRGTPAVRSLFANNNTISQQLTTTFTRMDTI